MDRPLSATTEGVIRRVWASRLGVPASSFEAPGLAFVTRPDLAAVVAVRLGHTTVVVAPEFAVAKLRSVASGRMLDMPTVLAALDGHVSQPIGSASLAYADRGFIATPVSNLTRHASHAEADVVLAACRPAERQESGLDAMPVRFVVLGSDGLPAALAGYESWNDAIAHLGVAVHPDQRCRGLGQVATAAAARDAIVAGLVLQWRSSVDNASSARLRDRLGFVQVGGQLAVELTTR